MSTIKQYNANALEHLEVTTVGVVKADGSHFIPGLDAQVNGFQPFGWANVDVAPGPGRSPNYSTQARNLVVNQGKNNILAIMFNDRTQVGSASWFLGLIDNTGFTGISATDTASSHPGWVEFVGYTPTARPAWGQAEPATGVTTITNPSPAVFDITATGTLKGVFVISNSTKGGTLGVLWAAAPFTAPVPVANGDQVRVSYSVAS